MLSEATAGVRARGLASFRPAKGGTGGMPQLLLPAALLLLVAMLLTLPGSLFRPDGAQAQVPPATVTISPATLNINVGQEATLDIFLNGANAAQIVAWENHFVLQNGAAIQIVAVNGEPVGEQGAGLALNGLLRLTDINEATAH